MSAAGAIGGALVSGVSNIIGGNDANSAAMARQTDAEQYNTMMSDTQYQRSVQDLDAAGLNPILAVGAQDTAPTIAPAPVQNVMGPAANAAISNYSALQGSRQTDPNIDNTKANTNLQNAQAIQAAAGASSAQSQAALNAAQTDKITGGSLMSDVIGSSNAKAVNSGLTSIIQGITTNSGAAGARIPDTSNSLNVYKPDSTPSAADIFPDE